MPIIWRVYSSFLTAVRAAAAQICGSVPDAARTLQGAAADSSRADCRADSRAEVAEPEPRQEPKPAWSIGAPLPPPRSRQQPLAAGPASAGRQPDLWTDAAGRSSGQQQGGLQGGRSPRGALELLPPPRFGSSWQPQAEGWPALTDGAALLAVRRLRASQWLPAGSARRTPATGHRYRLVPVVFR
jgi:hypothetical protein